MAFNIVNLSVFAKGRLHRVYITDTLEELPISDIGSVAVLNTFPTEFYAFSGTEWVKYTSASCLPIGGLEDQVLAKKSDTNYDVEWKDAGSGGGTPSNTVEEETSFGISPDAGTETTYSRGDHTHGTQTNPIPGHVAEEDPHPTYALDTDLSTHEAAGDPHTAYALDTDLSSHISASDPHTGYQKESEKGAASGYASLDATTKIPDSQIPDSIARDSEVTAERADHETDFNHALLHSNSLDHTQGTDQGLDNGGANAVTAAQTKTAYTHSQAAHAPSDAQKNSDILKSEIEAKLTGEISTHTHAGGGGGYSSIDQFIAATRQTPFFFTDFLGTAGAATQEASDEWDFAVLASGTQAKIAGEPNHPGILRVSSSTTTNSGGYCKMEATSFRIAGGEVFEIIFQHRVAAGANTTLRFGFHDSIASTEPVDGVYFEVDSGSLAITGRTASNSVRSETSTIYTMTVNTWYRAKLVVNSNATSVTFYLYDDAGSLLGSQSLTTNIPTGSGRETGAGFVATNVGTTAVLLAYFDWMAVWFSGRTLTR